MKSRLSVLFRKYHKLLGLMLFLPLATIVITGMLLTIEENWLFVDLHLSRNQLLNLHTGAIFNLHAFYPVISGLGFLGLILTGVSISLRLFSSQKGSNT